MRIVVVEDEAIVARRLVRLLREILGEALESVDLATSLGAAQVHLEREPPIDVLFLDLNLNGRDGFELLGEAVAGSFQTIVVSAHAERAIEAFDYGVLDFVAKPFGRERLELAIERLRSGRMNEKAESGVRQLAVRKAGRVQLVPVASVVKIQGADDYAELWLDDGSRHLHAKTLDALERLLPERFVRIHRSTLVDGERIEQLIREPGSRYFVRLRGGDVVRVGRSKLADVKARWL